VPEDKFTFASDCDTTHDVDDPALEVRVTEIGYADGAGFCPLKRQTVCPPEIAGMTGKDVVPTVGLVPSVFEAFAVIVAVPADIPLTIMLVLWVKLAVGLTITAGLVTESEIGTVFVEGETVALIVAVWPTATAGMLEKDTEGVVSPPPLP
jgi:hypothetical protein